MSMLEDIINWANTIRPWQADAVRRLLIQDNLIESDKNELFRMLKSEYGLLPTGESSIAPLRPMRGVVSGAPIDQTKLTLHAIEAIRNVNAIPDGSRLPFGLTGLTVFYGENASGKSGYARILKRACKARDTQERILPNVRIRRTTAVLASANIKISIDDSEPEILSWTDGVNSPEVLTNVAFFDSKCARIIVDDQCALSYLPYGADVFRYLGDLMNELKIRLQNETPSPTPPRIFGITIGTDSAEFLATLSLATSNEAIEAACAWSSVNDACLKELQYLIENDPLQLAAQLKTRIQRIGQLKERLRDADALVSDSAVLGINDAYNGVVAAEKALEFVAKEMTDEPLEGVGTNIWRMLYEAAKEYSTKFAYKESRFPFTEEGARCVLCMQPLLPDASERLNRFRKFMEDKTASEAVSARIKFDTMQKTLSESTIARIDQFMDAFETLDNVKPALSKATRDFLDAAALRLQSLRALPIPIDPSKILPPSRYPAEELDTVITQLNDRAAKLREQSQPDEQMKIIKERDELQSRKILTNHKSDLINYVGAMKLKAAYDRCASSLNTRAVSDTGKRIIAGALTPGYITSMKTELEKLGARYLDITPTPVAEAGETYHRFVLADMQRPARADLSEILSEGEQRVVAIAGFLAELAASEHKGPIVFDDPVCSLDHRYRDRIAARIATEAIDRQVIIFTHDISLLLELTHCVAMNHSIQWAPFTVTKLGQSPGNVKQGHPREAKSFGEQLSDLLADVAQITPSVGTNIMEYNKQAAAIYDRLRGAVDSFVEKNLFKTAVMRHMNRVSIDALDEVDCIDEDCTKLQGAYTLCGRYGASHDNALPIDSNRPLPAEIRAHITGLQNYATSVTARRSGMKARRKALREPVQSQTG